jgi:malonyl-CoA O-methyltransferase
MSDSPTAPPPFDALAARRWQQLAQQQAMRHAAPWLHEEVGSRMAQRLDWIKQVPARWVNWRALTSGAATHALVQAKYPKSEPLMAPNIAQSAQSAIQLTSSQGMIKSWLSRLSGRAAAMTQPVQDNSVQMVWANMSLHTEPEPAAAMKDWHRMLDVGGYLMFSCLGPDTARELRAIYHREGWPPAAHPLTDMHDWGDLLVRTGFAEPVMDMERIVLSFASPARALQELRGLGRNFHPERFPSLKGRRWHQHLLQQIQERMGNAQGQIEMSFEIIYGHAFKPVPRWPVSAESAISVRDMRAMLAQGKAR